MIGGRIRVGAKGWSGAGVKTQRPDDYARPIPEGAQAAGTFTGTLSADGLGQANVPAFETSMKAVCSCAGVPLGNQGLSSDLCLEGCLEHKFTFLALPAD